MIDVQNMKKKTHCNGDQINIGTLIFMIDAQNIKKLTARLIGALIFMIDVQNMRKLTARVIRLRPTPEETILQDFIPDHNHQLEIIEMIFLRAYKCDC